LKHCVKFTPYDIWFLDNSPSFHSRKLLLGLCPRCSKPVLELFQLSNLDNSPSITRKIGIDAHNFAQSLKPQVTYSLAECNYLKFKPAPFQWKYGINKNYVKKNGSVINKQFASDFFGNKSLVKKCTIPQG